MEEGDEGLGVDDVGMLLDHFIDDLSEVFEVPCLDHHHSVEPPEYGVGHHHPFNTS